MIAIALIAALFVAIALFLLGFGLFRRDGDETARRLDSIAAPERAVRQTAEEPRTLRARPGAFDQRVARMPFAASLRRDILRAGLGWQLRDYMALVTLSALVLAALGAGLSGIPAVGLLSGAGGALLPIMLIKRRGARRAAKLNSQLVDMVDLVASSLRSGFGFMQALELAAREQPEPIAGQLRQTIREINLGVSTDEALERLVARTGDPDFDVVVTAVLIQRRVGGNLSEVLDNISSMIRDRVRVRGEIKTLTAQARMSAWIVGLLPVGLGALMFLMQPEHMSVLFTEPMGRFLVIGAACMQVVGFFLVRRIASVDY